MRTVFNYLMLCIGVTHCFLFNSVPTRVQITTPVGDIIGINETVHVSSTLSYQVKKFFGIPYAEPPTGVLRFSKPVPKSNFTKPFDGTKRGPVCFQLQNPFSSATMKSEDCLRLDVYAPVTKSDQLKPVMVWIHGGGFINGGNDMYDVSVLSGFGDVIVVVINYRLAYFGFYTTGDSVASGNFGLWDQHLAINWTKNNIKAFGGDPDRITVFGESAGGSAVVYQAFYPGNKGLFKNAIAESGSITAPWAHGLKSVNVEYSKKFAEAAGCLGNTTAEYTTCLKKVPGTKLNQIMNSLQEGLAGPVVDYEFVLDSPSSLLDGTSNDTTAIDMFHSIDFMIGFNNADGMLDFLAWMYATNTTNPLDFHMPKDTYEHDIVTHYIQDFFKIQNVSEQARVLTVHEYTDWSDPMSERKRVKKLIDMATDYYMGVSSVNTAECHIRNNAAGTSTYMYEFAVQPLPSPFYPPVPPIIAGPETCKHADEVNFVLGMEIQRVSETPTYHLLYNTYLATMTMWSNFAKTGNPNLPNDVTKYINTTWPKFTSNRDYLRITPTMSSESSKRGMRDQAIDFWNNILPTVLFS